MSNRILLKGLEAHILPWLVQPQKLCYTVQKGVWMKINEDQKMTQINATYNNNETIIIHSDCSFQVTMLAVEHRNCYTIAGYSQSCVIRGMYVNVEGTVMFMHFSWCFFNITSM